MKTIEEMKREFGSVEYDDKEYVLTQDAYCEYNANYDRTYYTALAVSANDKPDEYGFIPYYSVEWEIINPDDEDESNACDWNSPCNVRPSGYYCDAETDIIF